MAKIKGGKLTFEVSDDGSLKLLEGKTKKTKKAVDDLGRSEATLNRNFKGASQQSSNQTKNFSKMAQGITGGLVPAYATLAANIFAIGAAFRFLQSAADFRILTQGQAEYATRTGQSLSIMTRQLQAATDGQLAFADAAQSVAIGTAAGLSIKQINELGVVAKNASLMLGRDLTDSFNRLVRGAVKAEPELLDELGIILRLETASEKYAISIGKTKDQLNIFEKSQAVVNEVLEQGLEKFGGVETQTNSLTKLAKSFDDLVNSIKSAIGPIAEFMAIALSQNTAATAGAGLLLGGGVLRAITPEARRLGSDEATGIRAQEQFGQLYSGKRSIHQKGALKAIERDMEKAYKKAEKGKIKSVFNVERFTRAEARRTLQTLKVLKLEEEAMNANFFSKMIIGVKATYATYRIEHGVTMSFIKTSAVIAGQVMNKALMLASYIGIAISIIGVLGQLFDKSEKAEKAFKVAQKEFSTLFSQNATDLENTIEGLKTHNALLTNALQTARALSNIDYTQARAAFAGGLGGMTVGGKSDNSFGTRINTFLAGIMPGSADNPNSVGNQLQATLSPEQVKGMTGMVSTLNSQMKLLVEGGTYHTELADLARDIQSVIDVFAEGKGTQGDFDDFLGILDKLEEGTGAQTGLNNLGMTTQIMASSAQDFAKALNSFRAPQTQLTRLTTNIKAVGQALGGVGQAFASGEFKMKMGADGKGTFFDAATTSMMSTFLPGSVMEAMKAEQEGLLAGKADMSDEDFAKAGGAFIAKYGGMVEAEAKRLHDIEMGMITGKVALETALLDRTMGQSKMRAKQLQKEGALLELQRQQKDTLTLIRELESKELDKDDAQIALENEKLDNIKSKIQKAKMEASALHQVQQTFRDSFESSMATAFQSIIEGTLNMKDAFLSMTKSILSAMAQVLAQQAAIAIMGSIPFFPGLGPKSRDGGILSSPGYRSFGTGGVSTGPDSGYPATLHGTEAVVPLPNGRSIPVEMSGGAGGNNISVNVNMTTGETSSEGSGEEAYALGRAISAAVQTELEKQQRPGGALSPY